MPQSNSSQKNRPLSDTELRLVRWMLEHGTSEASAFLPQLELVEVTPWRCSCGCASISFQLKGKAEAPPGVHVLSDYLFGDPLSGIFLYESGGVLSGLEVYALTGDAPGALPEPRALRPWSSVVSAT